MVYYYFPYSWVGGLILSIKRPQTENRVFCSQFAPKLAEVFFMSRVHNLSTGIRCCDPLHMSLGKPWGRQQKSVELMVQKIPRPPEMVPRFYLKKTTSIGELIPDFWLPSTISGAWRWRVLQYLKILWGLPVSVEVCQATSHPTTMTQPERLHRALHAPLATTQITCKTWAVMKAVESFG